MADRGQGSGVAKRDEGVVDMYLGREASRYAWVRIGSFLASMNHPAHVVGNEERVHGLTADNVGQRGSVEMVVRLMVSSQ
jgi:hypothetical protein